MKKTLKLFALAAAALAFVSACQKNEPTEGSVRTGKGIHFVVNAGDAGEKSFITYDSDTKKYTPKWNKGDKLGMFFTSITSPSSLSATFVNTAESGVKATFEGDVTPSAESGSFYSFYPAGRFEKFYSSSRVFGFNLGDNEDDYKQHPLKDSFDPDCDLLLAYPCDYTVQGGKIVEIDNLKLARMFSILKINLAGDYIKGDVVSSIKIQNDTLALVGRWSVDPVSMTVGAFTVRKPWVWAEYEDAEKPTAGTNSIYLIVKAKTLKQNTVLTITGDTDKNTISKTLTLDKGDFVLRQGEVTVLNLTINESDCTPKVNAKYILHTTDDAFENGADYIFAYKDGVDGSYYFINNAGTDNTLSKDLYTVSAKGEITTTEKNCVFTATTATTSGCFTLKNSNDKYIYYSGSGTGLNTNSTSGSDWLPTFIAASKTYKLQVGSTSGRYIGAASKVKVAGYLSSSFKDQVKDASAVAQFAGAISVFKKDYGKVALPTPQNLSVDASTKVVSWDAVSGAESYVVTVNSVKETVTSNSYTYSGAAGYFDVEVYAIPSDKTTKKNSEAATLTKAKFGVPAVATPELQPNGVTGTSIGVKWTVDPNATEGYLCQIYNGSSLVDEKSTSEGNVTFTDLTGGVTYTVKVQGKAVAGDYPYSASEIASIDLTALNTQVKDVTAEGKYTISGLLVYAVSGNNVILGDSTGKILLFKSGHGLAVGDKLKVSGGVVKYNGVWEFLTDISFSDKTSDNPVDPGTPVEMSSIPSYGTSPVIVYAHATGNQTDKRNITTDGTPSYTLFLSADATDTSGKPIEVTGYTYGYNSDKSSVSFLSTSLNMYGIVADPTSISLESAKGSTAKVTVTSSGAWTANTSEDWVISPASGNAGTTEVTITASKAGGDSEATLESLVFSMTGSSKSASVTVKQKKSGTQTMTIDFESTASTYTNWTFTNINSASSGAITAHGGSKYGVTAGTRTASIVTKSAIANPGTLKFYISKTSNNTTASCWRVKVIDSSSATTQVKEVSAVSMAKGTWVEVSADLSSYKNVKVEISYGESTAVRAIDDVSLEYE